MRTFIILSIFNVLHDKHRVAVFFVSVRRLDLLRNHSIMESETELKLGHKSTVADVMLLAAEALKLCSTTLTSATTHEYRINTATLRLYLTLSGVVKYFNKLRTDQARYRHLAHEDQTGSHDRQPPGEV
jgi:hypothetical protein